ncbi:MAG: LPS export ABC transporter permease LptF [Deltaproteobacteria bacterium]|nr:LPS export ABC transporter permease LptF [Deltaproteobacteria bacterium]
MGKILRRYVYLEIATPFFFALLIFTSILLTVRILKLVELVVNRGVPAQQVLKIFLYIIPTFLELTVPMSFLLAILWGLGRFSVDRELIALKSCGLSFRQLAVPVGHLTTVVLLGTFLLTLYVRPWSNSALRQLFYEVTKTRATAGLKEKTFNDEFDGFVVYAEEIEPPGTFLKHVMIADSRNPQQKNTIFARDGLVIIDEEKQLLTLRLQNGTIHSASSANKNYQTTHFLVYDLTLSLATALAEMNKSTRPPQEMSFAELRATIAQQPQERATPTIELLAEFHRRLALPFSCVVFALIALPLSTHAIWARRSHGFVISLAVIVAYYVIFTIGDTLGKKGTLAPAVALWLPNGILGLIGVGLFFWAAQEKPTQPFS